MTMTISRVKFTYCDNDSSPRALVPTAIQNYTKSRSEELIKNYCNSLRQKTREDQLLADALLKGLNTEWFSSLVPMAQRNIFYKLKPFLGWLSKTKKDFPYEHVFNLFQEWRLSTGMLQPRSTGTRDLIKVLKESLTNPSISNEQRSFIHSVVKATKITKNTETQPDYLAKRLTDISWLSSFIEPSIYSSAESPKRVHDSFGVTISSILFNLINARIGINRLLIQNYELLRSETEKHKNQFSSIKKLAALISSIIYNESHPTTRSYPLISLFVADFIKQEYQSIFIDLWSSGHFVGAKTLKFYFNGKKVDPCKTNNIISLNTLDAPSKLEQKLFIWLCAWQTVAASDIASLRKANFSITRSRSGKLSSIQCNYYKSRSSAYRSAQLLAGSSIETKAIISYLDYFQDNDYVIQDEINPYLLSTRNSEKGFSGRLIALLKNPYFSEQISFDHRKRRYTEIFPVFIKALFIHSKTKHKGHRNADTERPITDQSIDYSCTIKKSVPRIIFGPGSIKTNSVYARTDRYRDGDLTTDRSHSALTEKTCYLSDDNLEFQNRKGRISRAVFHDIESYVYKPNIAHSQQIAKTKILNTRIVHLIDSDYSRMPIGSVNQIGEFTQKKGTPTRPTDPHRTLVLDTPETVIYMLHYIAESERRYRKLLVNALPFLEKTVLPLVEWMTHVLSNLISPAVLKEGLSSYNEIKSILPELFEPQIQAGAQG